MTQYTQPQAYKHLLQVAENIIYSSQVDEQVLHKYEQLKKSILKKITKHTDTYYLNLLSSYRLLMDNAIKTVQAFQQELENQMERKNYNDLVLELNKTFQYKLGELETHVETNKNTKTRLLHKQQINTLKYQFDQLDSGFENLGLLIQVHKKMHQIILQATKSQQKKQSIESSYKEKIKQLQNQFASTQDTKAFIQQHRITQEKYSQFKFASKALKKVLFSQFK